jgi:uncharacterized protein (TIGR02588 family)
MSDNAPKDEHTGNGAEGRTIAEWTTLAISTAILLTIVGAITWLSFRGPERLPVIIVEPNMEQVREDASGWYLPVLIRNEGDSAVEDAMVQAELDTGSGQPEIAEITIGFLDGGEEVAGTFVFREDPSRGELTTGATSYKEP